MKLIPLLVLWGILGASFSYERLESYRHGESLLDCSVQFKGLSGSCDSFHGDSFHGDGCGGELPLLVSTSHGDLTATSLCVGNGGEQAVLVPTPHDDASFRGEGGGIAALEDDSSFHGGGRRLAALVSMTASSLLLKLFSVVIRIAACGSLIYLFVTYSGIRSCRMSSNFVRKSSNCSKCKSSKIKHYGTLKRLTKCKLRNECNRRSRRKPPKKEWTTKWAKKTKEEKKEASNRSNSRTRCGGRHSSKNRNDDWKKKTKSKKKQRLEKLRKDKVRYFDFCIQDTSMHYLIFYTIF